MAQDEDSKDSKISLDPLDGIGTRAKEVMDEIAEEQKQKAEEEKES